MTLLGRRPREVYRVLDEGELSGQPPDAAVEHEGQAMPTAGSPQGPPPRASLKMAGTLAAGAFVGLAVGLVLVHGSRATSAAGDPRSEVAPKEPTPPPHVLQGPLRSSTSHEDVRRGVMPATRRRPGRPFHVAVATPAAAPARGGQGPPLSACSRIAVPVRPAPRSPGRPGGADAEFDFERRHE
jgi:hypothetical protein